LARAAHGDPPAACVGAQRTERVRGERQMRRVSRTALAALLLVQGGCGVIQRPGWDKPWTYRSGVAAAVCAAVGAGAGVGIQEARTGCSTVTQNGVVVSRDCTSIGNSGDDTFWLWGALIGAVTGAVVCGILGHVFLDPGEQVAVAPPPPPPPEPT